MDRIIPKELKHDLYATHAGIKEATKYFREVIKALPADNKFLVIVAFQSFINTIIAEEDKLRDNN